MNKLSDQAIDKVLIAIDTYTRSTYSAEYGLPIEDALDKLRLIVRETLRECENDRSAFFNLDGKEHFCEESALAQLLDEGTLFISGQSTGKTPLELCINCNDCFYWASADAEEFNGEDLEAIYRSSLTKWGITKWVALHRGMRPQWPVVRDMIKDGAWDAELDALPKRSSDPYDHGWTVEREAEATASVK